MKSPCKNKCWLNKDLANIIQRSSRGLGSGICETCQRTGEEISNWRNYDHLKIDRIMSRLDERRFYFEKINKNMPLKSEEIDDAMYRDIVSLQKLTDDHINPQSKSIISGKDKLNCLILDDDQDRLDCFEKNFDYFNLIMTSDVDECINFVQNKKIDIIFLDHDLNGKAFVDSFGEEKTGYTVAKWLSENLDSIPIIPRAIYFHSLNDEGRKNMEEVIMNAIQLKNISIKMISCAGAWVLKDESYFNY